LQLTVDFTDPGLLDAHTVTIAWADGVTETIDLEAGLLSFDLEHVFPHVGSYLIELTLVDDDGASAVISFTVTMSNYQTLLPLIVRH
jgi:hypothetical protein